MIHARRRDRSGGLLANRRPTEPAGVIGWLASMRAALLTPVLASVLAVGCTASAPDSTPADGIALDAASIYHAISGAVAFVETPLGTGSAVLIAPERLITNAHVVWPDDHVRVYFPDGTELERASVVALDSLRDLALLAAPGVGTGGSGPQPVSVRASETLVVGETVHLIGYPAEVETDPQPAIASGLLSRRRDWEAGALAYFQTDASIAGGQSGGALVDAEGALVGISGLIFAEGAFGLASAADQSIAQLRGIEDGIDEASAALADREDFRDTSGTHEVFATLGGPYVEGSFVLTAAFGDVVDIEAVPARDADVFLELISPYGDLDINADELGAGGAETGQTTSLATGPHLVVVGRADGESAPTTVRLRSSHPLRPLLDPDDGMTLAPGSSIVASLDHAGDRDVFTLRVPRGRPLRITVDSANFVPDLVLEASDGSADWVPGVPGAGNSLGLAAEADLPAGDAATWSVYVADLDGVGTGGYFLHVRFADN